MSRLAPALHGAVGATLLTLSLHGVEEDRLVRRLADSAITPSMTEAERAVALTQATHDLVRPRTDFVGGIPGEWPWRLPQPVWTILVQGGACGGSSQVLVRMLQLEGIPARFAQLHGGAHIVVVAELGGRQVPLDPLMGIAYRRPDGRLASLEDVRADWPFYAAQTPDGFTPIDYSELRFTNWSKLPGMALVPKLAPDAAAELSIRSYVVSVYWTLAALVGGGYAAVLVAWGVARWSLVTRHPLSPDVAPAESDPRSDRA